MDRSYFESRMGATKIILFICKFRHCLIGLGIVLKWAYKACGSIVRSLVQMLDAHFSGFV